MIITIKFWKECVKAHQKMGRWVVRAAPAGGSPLPARPWQSTRLPHTAATKAAWSGLHGSFLFLLRGWHGGNPSSLQIYSHQDRLMEGGLCVTQGVWRDAGGLCCRPHGSGRLGGGEQGERWTLFLPNLVTWFQWNPDFPISSLNQVRWTKCKY